jgi:hypothetical protein
MFGFLEDKRRDLDQEVLDALKQHQANLLKPHKVEFFLHFPSRSLAEEAQVRVKNISEEFQTHTSEGASGNGFLCQVDAVIVPDISTLHRIRHDFENLCHDLGGKYDGWGTEVVR